MDQLGRSQQIRSLALGPSAPSPSVSAWSDPHPSCCAEQTHTNLNLRMSLEYTPIYAAQAHLSYRNISCLPFKLERGHDSPTDMPSLPVPTPGKGQKVKDAKNSDALWQSYKLAVRDSALTELAIVN